MALVDVSYVPGALTAITGNQCWMLVEASPDSPVVARIWQQLGQGAAAGALLIGLLADGRVPGFALLAAGADGQHRLFCRGTVGAALVSGDTGDGEAATRRVTGTGLLTWHESVVADARRIFLGEPPADTALRLPAASGVLLAGCVIIDFTNLAARETRPYEPERPEGRAKKTIPFIPDTLTVPPPDGEVSQAPAQVGGGQDNDAEYDFFWGATQMRSVEDAAVRGPADGGPLPPGPFAGDGVPMASGPWTGAFPGGPPPGMLPDPPPPSRLWQGPGDPVQLDGLPPGLAKPAVPLPARPLPGPPPGELIDVPQWLAGPGESASTVKRGDLPEPAAKTAPPDRIGPIVPALICPNGHVNPPSGATCRRCGTPLPHDPVPVPRPVLGVLRLSLGDVITLDRGVLMGRNPRADFAGTNGVGGSAGEDRPHVVKLPPAGGDVSRTHLQVTLDGWHVLVTDLNSTNGTMVTLPGRDPQQLRPGEPMLIQPGTVVALAEGIDFRYEVTD